MSYTVLARRYRSRRFGEVVGQEPIARTLQNAIAQDKVHHALLLTGTRGVGKTSMARIFACALNAPATVADCPKPADPDQYPDQAVQQRMAEAIMTGQDINVIEIDGASNRQVDDARQLIAGSVLAPTGNARYKIYIIDEVHMLTREAFNTLLKTMEEPPAHVKFVLCTTELQKVPATIQSRCQRFDFRNIPACRIAEHIQFVLGQEQVQADAHVVSRIGQLADGSIRDALSLLDRLIASRSDAEARLDQTLLDEMLGLPPRQIIEKLVDALAASNVSEALEQAGAALDTGLGQEQLIEALIEQLRQMMLLAACGADSDLVSLSDEARSKAVQQAGQSDAPALAHMIALCENLQRSSRTSSHPRALFDATLVRLALAEQMADVTSLLQAAAADEKKNSPALPAPSPPTEVRQSPAPSPASHRNQDRQQPDQAPPAAERAEPPAANSASQPEGVWEKLLASIAERPSLSWIQSLRLEQLDAGTAHLTPVASRRQLLQFLTPKRRDQLAALLADVLGQPVTVQIRNSSSPVTATDQDRTTPGIDQDRALGLPMVKQVLEEFDAVLVDARMDPVPPEKEIAEPASS